MVTVTNDGPLTADGSTVDVDIPAALVGVTWTCSPMAGSTCTVSGTGSIADLVDLPVGGRVTYTVSGAAPDPFDSLLTITALVAPALPVTDPDPSDNAAMAVVIPPLFQDGFESGDTSAWSGMVGG
jgi:hypothetical protein